jgi:hypothetical protein
MVDLNSSLNINGWSFYSILQQFEFKKIKNPTAAAHGGKEYIPRVGRGVTLAAR